MIPHDDTMTSPASTSTSPVTTEVNPKHNSITQTAWKIIPHFPCRSVSHSLHFYKQDLHFSGTAASSATEAALANPTPDDEAHLIMCSVAMGAKADANIYLFKAETEEQLARTGKVMIALGTRELDEYYDLLVRGGVVKIVEAVEDKPWGYRQFEVEDCDGNRLQFFRFLEGGNPGEEA